MLGLIVLGLIKKGKMEDEEREIGAVSVVWKFFGFQKTGSRPK